MSKLIHDLQETGIEGNKQLEALATCFADENMQDFQEYVEDCLLSDAEAEGDEAHDAMYDDLLNS